METWGTDWDALPEREIDVKRAGEKQDMEVEVEHRVLYAKTDGKEVCDPSVSGQCGPDQYAQFNGVWDKLFDSSSISRLVPRNSRRPPENPGGSSASARPARMHLKGASLVVAQRRDHPFRTGRRGAAVGQYRETDAHSGTRSPPTAENRRAGHTYSSTRI
jgi:hypothetical protein